MLADVTRTSLIALLVLIFATTAAGCASEPKPVPARLDPSNPAAPESAPLAVPTLNDPKARGTGGGAAEDDPAPPNVPSAAGGAHEHSSNAPPTGGEHDRGSSGAPGSEHGRDHADGNAPAKGVTYTCPMHPEVISNQPGKCPKCGMTLVPKEPAGSKH